GRSGLIPSALVHHPSPAVARTALEVLARSGRDLGRAAAALAGHPDPEVRAYVCRWRIERDADDVDGALDDDSPHVRAPALGALLARPPTDARAYAAVRDVARRGQADARAALARAIGNAGNLDDAAFVPLLAELGAATEPAVQLELVRALRALPSA